MIPVRLQPEPAGFDALVRRPGMQFLRSRGSSRSFPRYWRKITDELHGAYSGICVRVPENLTAVESRRSAPAVA